MGFKVENFKNTGMKQNFDVFRIYVLTIKYFFNLFDGKVSLRKKIKIYLSRVLKVFNIF